jgi:hypothetical protein
MVQPILIPCFDEGSKVGVVHSHVLPGSYLTNTSNRLAMLMPGEREYTRRRLRQKYVFEVDLESRCTKAKMATSSL